MEMVDLNCRALTKITLICLPYLSRGSRIMNVASAAAFAPQPSFAVYAAYTKSYVLSFSSGLGAESLSAGESEYTVCPGPVDTEFFTISGKSTNRWKNAVMASPENVVKKLCWTQEREKQFLYTAPMKAAQIGAKLFPSSDYENSNITRKGKIMQQITIGENEAGQRFDKMLAKYLNKAPKSFVYKMLRKKYYVKWTKSFRQ